MQKHEREALIACEQLVAEHEWPISLSIISGKRGAKLKMRATGPKGTRTKKLSSSPRSNAAEVGFAVRWLRRNAKDII